MTLIKQVFGLLLNASITLLIPLLIILMTLEYLIISITEIFLIFFFGTIIVILTIVKSFFAEFLKVRLILNLLSLTVYILQILSLSQVDILRIKDDNFELLIDSSGLFLANLAIPIGLIPFIVYKYKISNKGFNSRLLILYTVLENPNLKSMEPKVLKQAIFKTFKLPTEDRKELLRDFSQTLDDMESDDFLIEKVYVNALPVYYLTENAYTLLSKKMIGSKILKYKTQEKPQDLSRYEVWTEKDLIKLKKRNL